MSLFDIVIVFSCFLLIIWVLAFRQYKTLHRLFKYDKSDKCIRYCRICKQQQNLFEDKFGHFKWENVGEIKDSVCICHEYNTR